MEFSVLLSIYKNEKTEYFIEAINSILNQTIKPDEVVIVKDGPLTEELNKVIEGFVSAEPELFKIVELTENKGLGMALKIGVEACSFDVIARMDTDDISFNTRFEKQLQVLKANQDIAIVGTNALDFNGSPKHVISKRVFPENDTEIKKFSKRRCPFLHPTIMFKKKAIMDVGNYDSLLWFEDYYLFLKLIKAGYKGYNIQENLLYFRSNENTYRRRGGIKYLIQEYKAMTLFYKNKYLNFWYYVTNIVIRTGVRISGNKLRGKLYEKFLRA